MGIVMINCPNTGRPISTGIDMDRSSFNRSPVFFSRTPCPMYRTTHEWFAKDAWVREEYDDKVTSASTTLQLT
ncbi:MAG: hypothetical protein H3C55_11995 [Pseudorhodoplanes sp.]|nr:hypothetical protein [Pseudorhodoplanes sp.]